MKQFLIYQKVFGDTSDMITGCNTQPILNRETKLIKLDRIIASKFSIISNKNLPSLSSKAKFLNIYQFILKKLHQMMIKKID